LPINKNAGIRLPFGNRKLAIGSVLKLVDTLAAARP
jgi:hypothetical protein